MEYIYVAWMVINIFKYAMFTSTYKHQGETKTLSILHSAEQRWRVEVSQTFTSDVTLNTFYNRVTNGREELLRIIPRLAIKLTTLLQTDS